MDKATYDQAPARQRIAFYMAITVFLWFAFFAIARLYFAIIGDPQGDRRFVLDPTIMLFCLIMVLIWIISFVVVGNSVSQSKRITRCGIAALVMLTVPAMPVAFIVIRSLWCFATNP